MTEHLATWRGMTLLVIVLSLAGIGFDGTPRLICVALIFLLAGGTLLADYYGAVEADEDWEEGHDTIHPDGRTCPMCYDGGGE